MTYDILKAESKTSWCLENALYIQNIISLWASEKYTNKAYKNLHQGTSYIDLEANLWLFINIKELLFRQNIPAEIYFLRTIEDGEYLSCLLDSSGVLWNITGIDGVNSSIAHYHLPSNTPVFMESVLNIDVAEIPEHKKKTYPIHKYLKHKINTSNIQLLKDKKHGITYPILASDDEINEIMVGKFESITNSEIISKKDIENLVDFINLKTPMFFLTKEHEIETNDFESFHHPLLIKVKKILSVFKLKKTCIFEQHKFKYQLSETLNTLEQLKKILALKDDEGSLHIKFFDINEESPFFYKKLKVRIKNKDDEKTLIRFISLGALNESYLNEIDTSSFFMGVGFWGRGALNMNSSEQIWGLINDLSGDKTHHLYYEEQQQIKQQLDAIRIKKSLHNISDGSLKKERF